MSAITTYCHGRTRVGLIILKKGTTCTCRFFFPNRRDHDSLTPRHLYAPPHSGMSADDSAAAASADADADDAPSTGGVAFKKRQRSKNVRHKDDESTSAAAAAATAASSNDADDETAACTRCGYLVRNHPASMPG